jgi:hypothetical protein
LARKAALSRLRTARKHARGLRGDGKPLKPRDPRLAGLTGKERKSEHTRLHRKDNLAAGLRSDGKPRKTKLWHFGKGQPLAARHKLRCRGYIQARYAAGLTARGTPRKHVRISFPVTHFGYAAPMTDREIAWREIRRTMEIVLPAETILERE